MNFYFQILGWMKKFPFLTSMEPTIFFPMCIFLQEHFLTRLFTFKDSWVSKYLAFSYDTAILGFTLGLLAILIDSPWQVGASGTAEEHLFQPSQLPGVKSLTRWEGIHTAAETAAGQKSEMDLGRIQPCHFPFTWPPNPGHVSTLPTSTIPSLEWAFKTAVTSKPDLVKILRECGFQMQLRYSVMGELWRDTRSWTFPKTNSTRIANLESMLLSSTWWLYYTMVAQKGLFTGNQDVMFWPSCCSLYSFSYHFLSQLCWGWRFWAILSNLLPLLSHCLSYILLCS